MDGLDLLAELLSRFGTLMVPFHQVCSVILKEMPSETLKNLCSLSLFILQDILDSVTLSLAHSRPAIRKRTTVAIGM